MESEVDQFPLEIIQFTITGKVAYQHVQFQSQEMSYSITVNSNGTDIQSQMIEAQNVVVANCAACFDKLTVSMSEDGLLQIDSSSFPVHSAPQKPASAVQAQGATQNRFAAPRTAQTPQRGNGGGGNQYAKKAPTNWDAVGAEMQAGTASLIEAAQYGPFIKTQGQGNIKVGTAEGKMLAPRSFFENYMSDYDFTQEFSDTYLSQL